MLQRWNPITDFDRMWDEMDRMLSETVGRSRLNPRSWAYRPAIDVYDAGDHIVVKALIPGAKPDDIDLMIEQNTLTLKGRYGDVQSDEEAQKYTWYRREIGSGQFAESFTLPVPVEADKANANFENGVLTLMLPKAEQARVRRINVQGQKALEGQSGQTSQAQQSNQSSQTRQSS